VVGRDVTIGQYSSVKTPLHRVDPRLKVLGIVAGGVLVFIYSSGWQILAFTGMLLSILLVMRIPLLGIVKSLRTVWVIILVTFLLQVFLSPGEILWSWGFLSVTDTGLYNAVIFSARVVILVILLATLTMTTAPLKLADGLQSILAPLGFLKIPVQHVTTVVSITLMFIPNILKQTRKVLRAQMARGADFESANLLRRVRDIVPVLVPLFIKVFHDADELSLAMDSRVYASGRRGHLHPLKIRGSEALLTLLFVAAAIAMLFIP
jgi:energy-coupling factor transport system permease protein